MTDITQIPLSKLIAWEGNVRKTQNKGIDELAASIEAHGLLQSLVVRKDGKKYAVVAGSRRLAALNALLKSGRIKPGFEVPCQVIENGDATEISLAENVMREDMHPADQFEAFRDLADKGMPVTDIAARFGCAEPHVTRLLKLARVSPVILKAYRDGELTLEEVMAFTLSDDHERQEQVLSELENGDGPRDIRAALTTEAVAASDRRVKFVTLKAYEKAGGPVKRDLFSDDARDVYIEDPALLDRLVTEKLEKLARSLRKEGWKWVEAVPDFGYEQKSGFQRLYPEPAPLTPELQAEFDSLEQERDRIADEWYASGEETEEPPRIAEIEQRLQNIEDLRGGDVFSSEQLAIAGVVVTVGYDGEAEIARGLVRPEDMPKKTAKAKASLTGAEGEADGDGEQSPALSAVLVESLTAQRSAAISAELAQRPDIALAAVVHAFASAIFLDGRFADTSLEIRANAQSLRRVEGSKAFTQLQAARESWGQKIPGTEEAFWKWCLEQDRDVLLDLLAFCAAAAVNAVQMKTDRPDCPRLQHATRLATAVGLDMKKWFTPDADNYFSRVSKPQVLAAIQEAKGQPPAPAWEKLKKAELAKEGERQIAGTEWLPVLLR